jgi:hypothetical protein
MMKSREIRVVLAWMKMIFTSAGLRGISVDMDAVAQGKGQAPDYLERYAMPPEI